ncbi:MAG: glycosyltransferase, partial [Marinirhabdus sp.]
VAKQMVRKAEAIVGVSRAITQAVNKRYGTTKAQTIYNPIAVFKIEETTQKNTEGYIIFLGRLYESTKNFSLLLEGYKKSGLPSKNIKLKIFGDGPDRSFILKKAATLGLQAFVQLNAFTPHIGAQLKNAKFLVLTSHYEGFPRVLVEALSVGTPVVSVNCKSGPDEIIAHGENGLLVPNYDPVALAAAMDRFFDDVPLYLHCRANAVESVAHLHPATIGRQWQNLIQKWLR